MIEILAEGPKKRTPGKEIMAGNFVRLRAVALLTPWGWVVRNSKFKQSFTFFMTNM
jgi:hypothetical protein